MPKEIYRLSKETFMQQYVLKRARDVTDTYIDGRMVADEAEKAYNRIRECTSEAE